MGFFLETEDDFAEFFAEVFAGIFGFICFPTATHFLLNTTGFFFSEGFLCIKDIFNTADFLVTTGGFRVVCDLIDESRLDERIGGDSGGSTGDVEAF